MKRMAFASLAGLAICVLLLVGCKAPVVPHAAEATLAPKEGGGQSAIVTLTLAPVMPTADGASAPTAPPTPSPTPVPTDTPTPEPTPTPKPLEGIVIGLDPGHQRVYDPAPEPVAPGSSKTKQKVAGGCRGVKSRVYEYEVVLNVGLYLRELLTEAGATVVMTHDTLDVNISNIARAQIFNESNVDLGIRLHCNKASDAKVRGAFMIVPIESRTAFYEENVRAAKTILAAYLEETGLSARYKEGMTYRGDQTGFNWCTRPIINIEMGHLSNVEEDALLSTDAFQQTMAKGLFNGILNHFTGASATEPAVEPEATASEEDAESGEE